MLLSSDKKEYSFCFVLPHYLMALLFPNKNSSFFFNNVALSALGYSDILLQFAFQTSFYRLLGRPYPY